MREKVSLRSVKHPRYKYMVTYPEVLPDGRTVRRKAYFDTKEEAKGVAAEKKAEVSDHGAKHAHITEEERAALIRFRVWAAERRESITLLDLINTAIEAKEKNTFDATIQDLIDARILQAQKKKSAPRHLRDLEQHLNRFGKEFGKRLAVEVESSEIEQWIHGMPISAVTKLSPGDWKHLHPWDQAGADSRESRGSCRITQGRERGSKDSDARRPRRRPGGGS